MIPSGEALLLLNKWKTEKSPVRILFTLDFGGGSFEGTIAEIEGVNVQFISADLHSEFLFRLAGASFEYGDPREAPEAIREKSAAKYSGCLTAILPSGNRVAFFELRF